MRSLILSLMLVMPAFAQPNTDAEKLVAKALAATGWDKRTGDHMTWKDKGKFNYGGQDIEYEGDYHLTLPDKYRFTMKMKFNDVHNEFTVILSSGKGWETGKGKSQELAGPRLEYLQEELHQMNATSLKPLLDPKQFTLKMIDAATVDGRKCAGIAAEKAGKPTVKIWFDAETSLPAKHECKVKNEFDNWKETTDEIFYSEWSDDGGQKAFKKLKIVRNGKPMLESACSDFKHPEKVDPKLYEKP